MVSVVPINFYHCTLNQCEVRGSPQNQAGFIFILGVPLSGDALGSLSTLI
jgi:hypothetical protein